MSHVIFGLGIPEIVALKKKDENGECEIKVKCFLDEYARQSLSEILQKHSLRMREEKGFIIIYQ